MRELRIAVASSGVAHVTRGIETWAVDLTRALRARQVDACLFQGSGSENEHRITVNCLPRGSQKNKWLTKQAPGFFWRLGLKSPYEIEQTTFALALLLSRSAKDFDILHTQDPHLARILDRCHKMGTFRPKVLLAHGTEEPPEYLAKFSYLQHLAPQHAEEINSYKRSCAQWFVGPNFVDTERFYPGRNDSLRKSLGISPDTFVVITSAAVKRHHKRIDYLISEFAEFAEHFDGATQLVIAGASTADTELLREQAQQLAPGQVLFLLDQSHSTMPDILRMGDLFALCSLKEMMPIALLEAIATGLPCLVSSHPVVSWMKGPGGASVAMDRQGALATELDSWTSEDQRSKVGELARKHALTQFSEDAVLDTLTDIYQQVAA